MDRIASKLRRVFQRFPGTHPKHYLSEHFRPQKTLRAKLATLQLGGSLTEAFLTCPRTSVRLDSLSLALNSGHSKTRLLRLNGFSSFAVSRLCEALCARSLISCQASWNRLRTPSLKLSPVSCRDRCSRKAAPSDNPARRTGPEERRGRPCWPRFLSSPGSLA